MQLSDRIRELAPSLTVAIDTRAKQLAAEGVDIISLGAGEPDFPTPEPFARAGIEAILAGETRYGAPDGLLTLKQAVCHKLERENRLRYTPADIVITSGAKHAVNNTIAALINAGDEAMIPAPYWVTYPELVKFYGGVPRIVDTTPDNFALKASRIAAAITPRTKLLILNSPNNPSGAVIPREELEKIGELVVRHNLWVLSDEIYEHLIYDGKETPSIAQISPELRARTVIVNGVSKAYAMTGWRIGYTAAPELLSRRMAAMQGQTTHHPAIPSQRTTEAALNSGLETVLPMRREFERRRNLLYAAFREIPGIELNLPAGAFYLLIRVESLLGRPFRGIPLDNSMELCNWLLETERLALVPGQAFGIEGYLRLSFTAPEEQLLEAVSRFKRAVKLLENR